MTLRPVTAAIGLGANLGVREENIRNAVAATGSLPGTRLLAVSTLHETVPIGGPSGQGNYLNAAILIETSLDAPALLRHLLAIERSMGRDRAREERWGPRIIDLDLLLFGDSVIDLPGLKVPHPRMHERAFVLAPLAEIGEELMHPTLHRSVRELEQALRSRE